MVDGFRNELFEEVTFIQGPQREVGVGDNSVGHRGVFYEGEEHM